MQARVWISGVAVAALAAVGSALAVSGAVAVAAAPASGLTLASDKPAYAENEPVLLTLTAANRSSVPCQLTDLADGAVQVRRLTRDGVDLTARLAPIYYAESFAAEAGRHLRTVAPGGQVVLRLAQPTSALRTVSPAPGGGGLAADWPLTEVGRYRVDVGYSVPPVTEGGGPACLVAGTASVEFTVGMAVVGSAADRTQWIVLAGAGIGTLLLAVLVWWLIRRGRRRGPTAAAALLILFTGATVAGWTFAGPPRAARADWGIGAMNPLEDPKAYADFVKAVQECFALFRDPGGDPAGLLPVIEKKPGPPTLTIFKQFDGKGHDYTPTPTASKGSGAITWNNKSNFVHTDDGEADPCTELYHELSHAYDEMTGASNKNPCGATGVSVDEVRSVIRENQYRRAHGLTQRKKYGGVTVPTDLADCFKKPAKPKPRERPCVPAQAPIQIHLPPLQYQPIASAPGSSCSMNNGDPHLLTFDGVYYDFQAVGEFVNVRSVAGDLEVQTRQQPFGTSRRVSVNTAVALKVGADRLQVTLDGSAMQVRLNGAVVNPGRGAQRLPGGGVLTRRDSSMFLVGEGYTVTWPDGSTAWLDPIGAFGLRVHLVLAAQRAGTVTGLLGNFDGRADGDRANRAGVVLAVGGPTNEPTFEQLYRDFGDSWRVSAAESLFSYDAGLSTATYTDRTFPDRPISVGDLPAAVRDNARAACEWAGVVTPAVLDACVLDVGLTGQPAFAVNAGDTDAVVNPDAVAAAETGRQSTRGASADVTEPGGTATVSFDGSAGDRVYIEAVSGLPDQCGVLRLAAPDGSPVAGGCLVDGRGTIDAGVLTATGVYTITVDPDANATGPTRFTIITTVDAKSGVAVDGGEIVLTVTKPGGVARATFSAVAGQKVFVDILSASVPDQCAVPALTDPAGSVIRSGCIVSGKGLIDGTVLPVTGPYAIVLDPAGTGVGEVRLRVIAVHDQQVTAVLGGPPVTATVAQPGAVSSISFDATAGQRVRVEVTGATMPDACAIPRLFGPDDSLVKNDCLLNGGSAFTVTAPTTGRYVIVLDPADRGTGTATIQVRAG